MNCPHVPKGSAESRGLQEDHFTSIGASLGALQAQLRGVTAEAVYEADEGLLQRAAV